jgi:hypothetical protein
MGIDAVRLMRAGNVVGVRGVRRPRVPAAQAHERGGLRKSSGGRCRCRNMLLPLAMGNSQEFGSWRAAGCPGEVIRYAREFLVVDIDLLNDAGAYAYAKSTC